jgi:hypothetical protein
MGVVVADVAAVVVVVDNMIYLLIAIGLSSGGSTHLHTNNTQNNTNVEKGGPCPVFAS